VPSAALAGGLQGGSWVAEPPPHEMRHGDQKTSPPPPLEASTPGRRTSFSVLSAPCHWLMMVCGAWQSAMRDGRAAPPFWEGLPSDSPRTDNGNGMFVEALHEEFSIFFRIVYILYWRGEDGSEGTALTSLLTPLPMCPRRAQHCKHPCKAGPPTCCSSGPGGASCGAAGCAS
jgi:hypothetical protein